MGDVEKIISDLAALIQMIGLSYFMYYSIKARKYITSCYPGVIWNPVKWFKSIGEWETYYTDEGVRLVKHANIGLNIFLAVFMLRLIVEH